jgi:Tol biopolymer transport system component
MKKLILIITVVILFTQCRDDKSKRIDLQYSPQKAELFAEKFISTNLYERDIAISPDGDEIIFTLSDYSQSKRCLVGVKKSGKTWGEKQILSFSGVYNDIEPFMSVNGDKLYFASDRPIYSDSSRDDYNIWVSLRSNGGWSEPQPLDSIINTKGNEFYPSLAKNDNLYFTAVRDNGIGSEDIFISRFVDGVYKVPEPLDSAVNSGTYEFNAYISPEEDLIIFSSYGRDDDSGGGDLYLCRKNKNGQWTKAVNMGNDINSDKLDYCPFVDIPRGNFYFTSEKTLTSGKKIETVSQIEAFANQVLNGMGNIYRIRLDSIK